MKENEKHITWGCSDDLESRFHKTLYCGEEENCFYSTPSAALTDAAVSIYLDAAPSPKRRLSPRYASSIAKKMPLSPCTIVMGIMYLERLRNNNSSYLQHASSSDLFVVSMLIASKYLVDEGESDEIFNDEWAAAGGLAVSTINKLEIELLCALHWELYVAPHEFLAFCNSIETRIALHHGTQRGWFSYTDITHCLDTLHLHAAFLSVIENTLKVVAGCALAYGISVALVAGTAGVVGNASHSDVARMDICPGSGIDPYSCRLQTRERQMCIRSPDCNTSEPLDSRHNCCMPHLQSISTRQPLQEMPFIIASPIKPTTQNPPHKDISSGKEKDLRIPDSQFPRSFEPHSLSNKSKTGHYGLNLKQHPLVFDETFLPRFETRFEASQHISWFAAAVAF